MDDRRKYALLFAATILAARKLHELDRQGLRNPCPARLAAIADAISDARTILEKIEQEFR